MSYNSKFIKLLTRMYVQGLDSKCTVGIIQIDKRLGAPLT